MDTKTSPSDKIIKDFKLLCDAARQGIIDLDLIAKEIGIEYRSPHQMRKTYASILLSSGVDEAVIKREMRHTEISTTRAYYQYITKEDDYNKELIDKITGL